MKPIEPGCLALCIWRDVCSFVTVTRQVSDSEMRSLLGKGNPICMNCKSLRWDHYWWCDGLPGEHNGTAACCLYPLDGHEKPEETEALEAIGVEHA